MSAYLLVQVNIKNKTLYEEYINKVLPLYQVYNAKVLAADGDPRLIEGEYKYNRIVIIEFEDLETLKKAWAETLKREDMMTMRREASDSTISCIHGADHL